MNEVMQNEKKLKVKSLLKLYTHSKGEINIKQFFSEFSEPSQEKCDTEFVTCFPYINVLRKVSNDVLSSLLYTSGYVARKVLFKIQCDECKDLIGDKKRSMDLNIDPEHFKYTEILDRGGLVYPSDLLFMVLQISYNIFNICVDEKFEAQFLKLANQKQTLIAVIEHCLTSGDDYMETFYVCELCETPCMTHLLKAISCLSNICLNNYSISSSEKTVNRNKQTRKKNKQTSLTALHYYSFVLFKRVIYLNLLLIGMIMLNMYVLK